MKVILWLRVTTTRGAVLQGLSIGKVENHCFKEVNRLPCFQTSAQKQHVKPESERTEVWNKEPPSHPGTQSRWPPYLFSIPSSPGSTGKKLWSKRGKQNPEGSTEMLTLYPTA